MADLEKEIVQIVQLFLRDSGVPHSQAVNLQTSFQKHLGIDSLGKAELLQRIEKHFQIQLPADLLTQAETLQDILNAIQKSSGKITYGAAENIIPIQVETHHVDPSHANTLVDVLLLYALQTPDRPHVYFQDEFGKEELITYGQLLEVSQQVAYSIGDLGIMPGETIALMQPTHPGFLYTFLGILIAGCIPVPIYPPLRPHQIEAYAKQEAKILQNAEVRLLITFHEAEHLSHLLRSFIPSLKTVTTVTQLLQGAKRKASIYPSKKEDFALIQYTSGSTNLPKGVLLTHGNLLTNIRAFGKAIAVTQKDIAVSWAPLYHDLGLIGLWLGSLYHGLPLVLLSPITFLMHPERWLWAIHHHRGTITGGPNFAYELCVRKIEPEMIHGLDISSWRLAFNAAEAVIPQTLDRFSEYFAPYGFKREKFYPVYGLAESTVCLAVPPLGRGPRIDIVDRKTLEQKHIAEPVELKTAQESAQLKIAKECVQFVGCGMPLPDHAIRIVDEDNNELSERQVGRIQFRGPSSMQGYYRNPEATQAIYHDGWWDTGDVGYLADSEVFITGREKDIIIKAGRNLYPAEIEDLTGQITGVRKGCVVAFGITDAKRGTEKLIIVAESTERNTQERRKIAEHISQKINQSLDIAPDQVIIVKPRTILKTSSGKLQRSACKQAFLSGKISKEGMPVWWQMIRLNLQSFWQRSKKLLILSAKSIYTVYLSLLFIISLVLLWLSSFVLTRNGLATICKWTSRILCILAFCPIRVSGKEHLKSVSGKPVIFAVNHASFIDSLVLLAFLPTDIRMVGKAEILKIPLLNRIVKKLEYLTVQREDISKSLEASEDIKTVIKQGHPTLIFPEGTFSYVEGLRPFKLGAFKIAAETNTLICPIALTGTRMILRATEKLFKPGKVEVIFLQPVKPEGNDWFAVSRLKNTVRAEIAAHCNEPTLDFIVPTIAGGKANDKPNDD